MVAKYKQKRLAEEWTRDKSRDLHLEGSEREAAKRECRERLEEAGLIEADRLDIQCSQNTEQNPKPLPLRSSFALFLVDYKASRNR